MRVPYSWLTEYCDPGISAEELAERLSMTGTEVERVAHVGAPSAEGFVIGRVLSVEPHPNADRLTVCEVDTGDGARTIVCGAPNVAAGQTVPVALPGAVLPDGRELGRAKLRGVVSDGMILSEAELGIGEDAAGIMVLEPPLPAASSASRPGAAGSEADLAPGTSLSQVLPISEPVLELEVTPNRPDCLGVYGVAREVHAITGAPLAAAPWEEDVLAEGEGQASDYASVTVEVPELCPRFTGRVFLDVAMGPSPPWLRARLIAAGQRPISNVVDVTNYAMLLTAQPLHAFDLDRVPGGELIVRTAREGEKLRTLDGIERAFDSETVLVCDRDGPSGIAGIMGGQVSEVSDQTGRILLEVATWNGVNILRTSSMLGLRSEASTRFEKQLHPELAIRAQRVASRLIVETAGATLVPGTIDVQAEQPSRHVVSLHGAHVSGLLGMSVARERSREYLERLGFDAAPVGEDDLDVTVPPERHFDVSREADVIEEVARIHGLDEHLPATLPEHGQRGSLTGDQRLRRRLEDVLRDLGFDEIVGWSFVSPQLADRLRLPADDARRAQVAVLNPLSEEHSAMRTTLLGGLLDAARHNLARHADRVALFESGRAYLRQSPPAAGSVVAGSFVGEMPAPVAEPHRIAGLVVGSLRPRSWHDPATPESEPAPGAADLLSLKGVLEALFGQLGVEPTFRPATEPFLHPGRAAAVEFAGVAAGWLGELHPEVAREWDLPGGAAFELDVAPAFDRVPDAEQYEDVTTYPALYEDVAVVVPEEIPAERVRSAVREAAGELLRSARIFDLYRGEQIGEGSKSLALRLEFRAPDRTLTAEEVAAQRASIRGALESLGGSLRE